MLIHLLDLKRFLFFRSLITYLECSCKIVELRLENCELTCNGVRFLLECLSVLEKSPSSLAIGSNPLGRFG